MNKKIFSLLCLTVLAIAVPSCRKRTEKQDPEINTMIEFDNEIASAETENDDTKNVKF
jgi:hypothetical protein